ncbi:4'-phosphopantetheinyl transferase superfamily protein [Schaalia sp. ZJ1691]|uniref:4'-phosphopantetheinyl transferase family protein n=1 Tax=Schaalia sp. ZJ1691 TaxID=2709404 RepID=UPI0013EDFF7F|nr:4'-phosphopantetheinyl transferase superfamily protein [Schaalia sp. ZJ1691]
MYDKLFPAKVYVRQTWDTLDEALFPSECTFTRGATPERYEEFISVRACARDALQCLGKARPPLIAHAIRGLQWPEGTTGSLTHTGRYRAAAVASSQVFRSIGIDAESATRLPQGLRSRILTSNECEILRQNPDVELSAWDTVIFSSKEAVYKAYAPATGRFLDFLECELVTRTHGSDALGINAGSFSAVIREDREAKVHGAWIIEDHIIHSAAWMSPRP